MYSFQRSNQMANAPLHKCNKIGCTNLTHNRFCEKHKQLEYDYDKHRQSAHKRGYNRAWQKASKSFLASHPFCVRCLKYGIYEKATVVDHIKPHKGDGKLFWDKTNWQPLCKRCHDIKTVTEDGGFGR